MNERENFCDQPTNSLYNLQYFLKFNYSFKYFSIALEQFRFAGPHQATIYLPMIQMMLVLKYQKNVPKMQNALRWPISKSVEIWPCITPN